MDFYKSPRFSDVKKIVLELETTKNPMNFLLKTPWFVFSPETRLGGICTWPPGTQSDVIMGDIHLKGSFNKIRVWSWELHLPQLPTFFLGEKHTSFFLATNKNLEQKKNIPKWGKKSSLRILLQTLGSWKKHVPVSLAKRSQCRHSRHGSCGEQFVVCRGDDQMMILWIYGFQLLWLLWFIIIRIWLLLSLSLLLSSSWLLLWWSLVIIGDDDCNDDDCCNPWCWKFPWSRCQRFFLEDRSGGQLQPKVQFYRLQPRRGRVQDGPLWSL